jgi:tetratricopeptide (TPR) repeat protein/4-amino-4-deoxy-L-arabinose transferase-like glycosyltransferase
VKQYLARAYSPLLLALVLLGFLLSGYGAVVATTQSDTLDQGSYLTIGLAAREEGRLTDPYRQPLFSWLLAPFAQRELSYFTWAKLVTLASAAVTVLGSYLIAARLSRNRTAGLCVALLVAGNRTFLQESGMVMVEPLLALLMLLIWYVGLRALETEQWRYWLLGGALTGVGYLAKDSAAAGLVAAAAGAVAAYRQKARGYLRWLAFAALALLFVSPTLVYNVQTTGAPVQTGNMNALWLDDWEQFFAVGPTGQFSMSRYFQTHSPADVANRLYEGLVSFAVLTLSIFLPLFPIARWVGIRSVPPWLWWVAVAVGTVLIGLYFRAGWTYVRKKGRFVIFTATFLAIYCLVMVWIVPVTYDARYVTPLLPVGYTLLLGAAIHLGGYTLRRRPEVLSWLRRGATAVVVVAILSGFGRAAADFRWTNVFANDEEANRAQTVFVRALGVMAQGATIVHGPSHGLPAWLIEGRSRLIGVPSNVDWSRLSAYLRSERAQYLVMTPELYLRRLNLFRDILYPAWPETKDIVPENDRTLGIRVLPASWELALAQGGLPSTAFVFRLRQPPAGEIGKHITRGDDAVARGDWERADSEYAAAVRLSQGDTASLERALGQIAWTRGRSDDARRHFDQAIVQQPQDHWYRTLRGDLLATIGDPAGAAADYEAALAQAAIPGVAGSGWANVQAGLGQLQERQGNGISALIHFRQAVSLCPNNPWYEALLGRALAVNGLAAEAIPHYRSAAKEGPHWAFLDDWLAEATAETNGAVASRQPIFQPLAVQYADGPELKGYRIDTSHVGRDGVIDLILKWTPGPNAGRTERGYAKLLNTISDVWGEGNADLQRQGVPAGPGSQDITLEQLVEIPVHPGTPPGSYSIALALQSVTTNTWLQTANEDEVKLGSVELPQISWSPERLDLTAKRAATLDGKVRLLGYRLSGEARPGQTITLTLFWQATDQLSARYTVFTHLTDPAGELRSQKDNEPADGFYPTDAWARGQIVRDSYALTIPVGTPPGEYVLQAGMYLRATGQRLAVTGEAAAPEGDAIVVTKVTVE